MSDDDPFVKKKRSNKATKRRKRPERLSFAQESDSDNEAPAQRNSHSLGRTTLGNSDGRTKRPLRTSFPRRNFGVPGNLDADNPQDEDARRDYSAQGLQRLREQTARAPANGRTTTEKPIAHPAFFIDRERADVQPLPQRVTADDIVNAMEIDTLSEPVPTPVTQAAPDEGFIALDRERTEAQLGAVYNMDELQNADPMLIDDAQSGADEWEKEQLRRAGLPIKPQDDLPNAMARSIIEEEDLNLGARGEVGLSVVDTCLEGVEEALRTTQSHIDQCESKLNAVRNSGCDAAFDAHDKAVEKADTREKFYTTLAQFATDVSDMLADRRARITARFDARKERLRGEADDVERELTTETDDFGRARDVATVLRKYYGDDAGDDEAPDDDGATEDEVFADVEREFRSIGRLSDVFRDWRSRFPDDYEQAFGDKSVGKICGAVAMCDGERLEWLCDVPTKARMFALEASRLCELVELRIKARWRPASRTSTREHYKIVREVAETKEGAEKAVERLFVAFLARFKSELQMLRAACADEQTGWEALLSAVRHATLFFSKCFAICEQSEGMERRFVEVVLGDGAGCVEKAAGRADGVRKVTMWSEFVDAVVRIESVHLKKECQAWDGVRSQVQAAVEVVEKDEITSDVRSCLERIGVGV